LLYWLPALFWMLFIFYLSGRTGGELHALFPFLQNFNPGHVAAYFVLALLYYAALRKNSRPRPFLTAWLLCLLYGISDEAHQYFVPTRHPDAYDLLRDMLGASLALLLAFLTRKKNKNSRRPGPHDKQDLLQ